MLTERIKIANLYSKYLSKYENEIEIPLIAKKNNHTWFVYVVRIKNKKINRDKIIKDLLRKGISTKSYLPSIHLFSFYKNKFGYKKDDFPLSEMASKYSLALPFYIGLKENDIKYISNKIIETIQKYGKRI